MLEVWVPATALGKEKFRMTHRYHNIRTAWAISIILVNEIETKLAGNLSFFYLFIIV